MIRAGFTRWLRGLPLNGPPALLCLFAAVAVPTLVRAAIDGVVTGCEFTPYLPFVFLAAILLRWWTAALVALASVAVLGGLFASPLQNPACFLPSAGIFLASSAAMIGAVIVIRSAVQGLQQRGAEEHAGDIVFSLMEGEVWASWYGQERPLRLGTQQMVSQTMEDFLAEMEIGKRLTRRRR